jgi:hypothetical protein
MSASKLLLGYCRLHPPFQITGLDRCDTLLEGLPPCRIEIAAPVRSLLANISSAIRGEMADMLIVEVRVVEQANMIRMNLGMYGKRTVR